MGRWRGALVGSMPSKTIRVCVRTRPTASFAAGQIDIDSEKNAITINKKQTEEEAGSVLNNAQTNFKFQFHHVLHNASQDTVYETLARDVVQDVVDGINGTIMRGITHRCRVIKHWTQGGLIHASSECAQAHRGSPKPQRTGGKQDPGGGSSSPFLIQRVRKSSVMHSNITVARHTCPRYVRRETQKKSGRCSER